MLDKAIEATSGLGGVGFCADVKALAQAVPPESPEARKAAEELRGRLEEVRVRDKLGRYEEALGVLAEMRPRVEALRYQPLFGELCLQESQNLNLRGKYAEAVSAGQAALQTGFELRDWDLVIRAAQDLAGVVGVRMKRHQEGLVYARIAVDLSKGLGDEREILSMLRLGEAEAEYRLALDIFQEVLGPDHPDVSDVLMGLGELLVEKREVVEALSVLERARVIRDKAQATPDKRGEASFRLARVLWTRLRDRGRARSLAKEARELYASSGNDYEALRREVERWIAEHRWVAASQPL